MTTEQALAKAQKKTKDWIIIRAVGTLVEGEREMFVRSYAAELLDAQSHVFAELAKAIPPFADIVYDLRKQAEELRSNK